MTHEIFTALMAFAFVSSITPGPNNLMLLASGANFGFRRTVPHMLGISIGHSVMVMLVGIGLIRVFDAYPLSQTLLKVVAVAYMLWLAWKIAHAAAPEVQDATGKRPLNFFQAALFQWVNPKAWTMALTAITVYAADRTLLTIAMVAAVFAMTNLPSICTWAAMGQQLRRLLTKPSRLRLFNWTMAILLVASLWPVLYH
ncbi:LysE family translocator [Pseudooceanicola sp.]|uniref:LysE family translocator n=1 Tax=Pseudooceanicola sp. TaxID=1914328 RepID=UPI0026086A72|nr:LysE family translocator [Pseudooceanicola sp.]MDF1857234.1 LysE family translocator [Pseudooceanicola sp.]